MIGYFVFGGGEREREALLGTVKALKATEIPGDCNAREKGSRVLNY
jgi:hypothetical protein